MQDLSAKFKELGMGGHRFRPPRRLKRALGCVVGHRQPKAGVSTAYVEVL